MTERSPLVLVVAMAKNRVIGKNKGIPWDLPEDRKHFVAVTRGHALIMGRATFDSIGKPLTKRRNIVISRNKRLDIEGVEMATSLEEAIEIAREEDDAPRIIGGGQIYAESLPLATRVYLTELDEPVEGGDTWFPELPEAEWKIASEHRGERARYLTFDRVK